MNSSIDARLRRVLGERPKTFWDERMTAKLGPWGERISAELFFAHELSKAADGKHGEAVDAALRFVEERLAEEGVVSRETALRAEELLAPLAGDAKSYEVLNVAHAHIDMNWMWSWDETVAVTLDTFRTMLTLMEEYPEFTFSQSQASIYRIVERYDPDMLEEIRRRVKEGRWEVTASHWVEADKNMPSGESLTRHLLYTKRYLSKLFDLDPDSLNLDFEPDTFGHSANVPDILASGGVKYYYHCRGNEAPALYRWQAPSGKSVIVYREPTWYNDNIQSSLASYVPSICKQTGLKTYLNVYGVGDHGGGPTRRDLERLLAMGEWPIYPKLRFGTYREYFALAETVADRLPVVTGEQNFVFTGCYTSQTRIKNANRIGEATLGEAEWFSAAASLAAGSRYPGPRYEEAWRNVLFNQFHDILPGSGVIETREHALGLFQETMATANTERKRALERLAATIDTSGLAGEPAEGTVSEGAGAGYGARSFQVTQVERGRGGTRIVHVFNPSPIEREEVVEIIMWDWKSPIRAIVVRDANGQAVPSQQLDAGTHWYWNHDYSRLLAYVRVPAGGYATFTVSEGEESVGPILSDDPRVDRPDEFVLENDRLRVEYDPVRATVRSMIRKDTGEELVDPARPAGVFRHIIEDTAYGMTSWRVGRYKSVDDAHRSVKLRKGASGDVRQSLEFELVFGRSSLKASVSLDRGADVLVYDVTCDWQEAGTAAAGVPQLGFHWPAAGARSSYQYDVPFGVVRREAIDDDVPANSFAVAEPAEPGRSALFVATNNKYGFRGFGDAMNVTLIRGSYEPDPYPELGNHHRFSLAVGPLDAASSAASRIAAAQRFNHPLSVLSGTAHAGTRPLAGSFLELLEGTVAFSGVKMPEEEGAGGGKRWIVRLYETEGAATAVKLKLPGAPVEGWFVDATERRIDGAGIVTIDGDTVSFEAPAFAAAAVCLKFE